MRTPSPNLALIPYTIEQATNHAHKTEYNTTVIKRGEEFFLVDYADIRYDDTGARVINQTSTKFLERDNFCVFVLSSVHARSLLFDGMEFVQQHLDKLPSLKMFYDGLVVISQDSPDDLHDALMVAVRNAKWYSPVLHDKRNILSELKIFAVSDQSFLLRNALGLVVDSPADTEAAITSDIAIISVIDGVVAKVEPHKSDAMNSSNDSPESDAVFALIPSTIKAAIERQNVTHNRKVVKTGDNVPEFEYERMRYNHAGQQSVVKGSTIFLRTGRQCIITVQTPKSIFSNYDEHLQDYINMLPRLRKIFDTVTIVAKANVHKLNALVWQALESATWQSKPIAKNVDLLAQFGIAIIPDTHATFINMLGLAVDSPNGISSKTAFMIIADGRMHAARFANDPLVRDQIKASVAMEVTERLQLPPKATIELVGERPEEKLVVVGGGIVAFAIAVLYYQEALQTGKRPRLTMLEAVLPGQTVAENIGPSLTIDESSAVVPTADAFVEALTKRFDEPGGITISETINQSPVGVNFRAAVELDRRNSEAQKLRADALLQFGVLCMHLWDELYQRADKELRDIFHAANYKPCREPLDPSMPMGQGMRIDLIYATDNARRKAEAMEANYRGAGYPSCRILTPDGTAKLDPSLKHFCDTHSELNESGQRVWKHDAIAILRPGGCINAKVFLPKLAAYLTERMGKYHSGNTVKNCFRIKYRTKVTGVVFGHGELNGTRTIKGLRVKDPRNPLGALKTPKYPYKKVTFAFAPGGKVGTLSKLGFIVPAYAAFAGVSLSVRIPFTDKQVHDLDLRNKVNHCMELHHGHGVVLAWQAVLNDASSGHKVLEITVAGTKGFSGDQEPHKDDEFTKNRNLMQFNMIKEVFGKAILIALDREITDEALRAQLTWEDLVYLERKNMASRWCGNRALIYDGLMVAGDLYTRDHHKVDNAVVGSYMGSGGVSCAIGLAMLAMYGRDINRAPLTSTLPAARIDQIMACSSSIRGERNDKQRLLPMP